MTKKEPLTFHRRIPAFLQQMQNAQAGGQYDQPNPQLARNRRHGKPRSKSEEAEDAPLVLDGDGNVVEGASVDVHGEVVSLGAGGRDTRDSEGRADEKDGGPAQRQWDEDNGAKDSDMTKVLVGNTRKRKVGRVVGGVGEENEDDDRDGLSVDDDDPLAKAIKAQGRSTGLGRKEQYIKSLAGTKEGGDKNDGGEKARKRKKARKIKLSFEGDES